MASEAKVALITGGASGMGLAVTERLVELGWNCAIVDFNQNRGEEVKQRLGSRILFIKSNVAIYEQLSDAFVQTWKKWGRLDFVHANAGIGDRINWYAPAKELPDGSPEKPDTLVIDICLIAVVWSSYLAMHYFRKNQKPGGKLVFTSSQCGFYPGASIPLYTAAKHGVVGLTRAMGQQLKQSGEPITVNCICPGLVPTNIMPDAITQATPKEHITPLTTVVRAVEGFINDDSLQGQAAECSAQSITYRPQLEYADETTKFIYSGVATANADREALARQLAEKKEILATSLAS